MAEERSPGRPSVGSSSLGAGIALLVLRWNRWVHRRVELVTFTEEGVRRRSTNLEFTIPGWLEVPSESSQQVLLPVTRLQKRVFTNFDLRDEAGDHLPLLTAAEANEVVVPALWIFATAVVGDELPDDVKCDIRAIVTQTPTEARNSLNAFIAPASASTQVRKRLADTPPFWELLAALATHYLLLIQVSAEHGRRRVISFSYDEDARPLPIGVYRRVLQGIGWKANKVWVPAQNLGDVASFHLEVAAPEGQQVSTRYFWMNPPEAATTYPDEAKKGRYQRARFYIRGAPPGAAALATVNFRPRSSTFVRAGALTAVFTVALLGTAAFRLTPLRNAVEATAALLLVVPTGLAAFAARPVDDPVANNSLFLLRILTLVPGICSFLAAGSLVLDYEGTTLTAIWWSLVGTSVLAALLLAGVWRRTRVKR